METALFWKSAGIAVWFAAFFLAERVRPAAPSPRAPGRLAKNGGLWTFNLALSPLFVLPLTAAAAAHAPDWRPAVWSGAGGLILDLVLLDLWIYWQHRAYHTAPWLWRLHEPHHLDETLDATSAVRFHFGEVAVSALSRAAVVFALAIPFSSVLVFEALVLAAAIFHHSNVRLPVRAEAALSKLVVTPSIHWVHHHAVAADTDSNYATVLSVWDRLFASASATRRWPQMPIGVEGARDVGFLALILDPFRGRVRRSEAERAEA